MFLAVPILFTYIPWTIHSHMKSTFNETEIQVDPDSYTYTKMFSPEPPCPSQLLSLIQVKF